MIKEDKRSVAEFIGKPIEHAEKYVSPVRVVAEDGKRFIVTAEYVGWRLNVETDKGIVTHAYWG